MVIQQLNTSQLTSALITHWRNDLESHRMIYEVRTYDLKPGAIPQAEEAFAEALPYREIFSPEELG